MTHKIGQPVLVVRINAIQSGRVAGIRAEEIVVGSTNPASLITENATHATYYNILFDNGERDPAHWFESMSVHADVTTVPQLRKFIPA